MRQFLGAINANLTTRLAGPATPLDDPHGMLDWGIDELDLILPLERHDLPLTPSFAPTLFHSLFHPPFKTHLVTTSVLTRSERLSVVQFASPTLHDLLEVPPWSRPPQATATPDPVLVLATTLGGLHTLTASKTEEFCDKLKYNLIMSALLDDSMLLSQSNEHLERWRNQAPDEDGPHRTVYKSIYGTLEKLPPRFGLAAWPRSSLYTPVRALMLVRHVMKHAARNGGLEQGHRTAVAFVVVYMLSRYRKRLLYLLLQMLRTLERIRVFTVQQLELNRLMHLFEMQCRESSLYASHRRTLSLGPQMLPPSNQHHEAVSATTLDRAVVVAYLLDQMVHQMHASISQLLPHLNGDLLDKYCHVYGLEQVEKVIGTTGLSSPAAPAGLRSMSLTTRGTSTTPPQQVPAKMQMFHQLRKLYICCLLTADEPFQLTFSLSRLWRPYGITRGRHLSADHRSQLVLASLHGLTSKLTGAHQVLGDVVAVGNSKPQTPSRRLSSLDTLVLPVQPYGGGTPSLARLSHKVAEMSTTLQYLQDYGLVDEHVEEKAEVLQQVLQDLDHAMRDCRQGVQELRQWQQQRHTPNANLRAFSTGAALRAQQRLLLPLHVLENMLPEMGEGESQQLPSGRLHKRLSAGLLLGLLTVFEEDPVVLFDDNYVNLSTTGDMDDLDLSVVRHAADMGALRLQLAPRLETIFGHQVPHRTSSDDAPTLVGDLPGPLPVYPLLLGERERALLMQELDGVLKRA